MRGMGFPVDDVTDWAASGLEQRGATEHLWLTDPRDGEPWLWKPATGRRLERREHWAEKVASEVALLLELPCARIELAVRKEAAGCLSRNVLESGRELYPGAYLLADLDPSFDPRVKGHPAYTVENVAQVLRSVQAPPTVLPKGSSGFDLFTGYLVFDALVLNRDRHAANWAVLRRRDGSEPDRLCPLYDNASSLGMAQAASTMARRLASRGVDAYVAREGAARPFARPQGVPPTLFDVAGQALALCSPAAKAHWLAKVQSLQESDVRTLVAGVPGMSEVVRTFTVRVVASARERIVHARPT